MAVLKSTARKSPSNNIDSFPTFIMHNDILKTAHDVFIDSTQSTSTSIPIYELGKHLLSASKSGNVSEIKSLMGRGAAFTPDWLGACPLHYAASNGHVGACEVLLRAGISRNSRTKVDRTPLHMAVYEGHVHVAQCLIRHGADVNARDMLLMTPLQWAVQRAAAIDSVALVGALLKHGATVRTENKFGNTALDIARQMENAELVAMLQKASVEQADQMDSDVTSDELWQQCNNDDSFAGHPVNEYLNDVIKLPAATSAAKASPVAVLSCHRQQQVITIEDCVDDEQTNVDSALVKTVQQQIAIATDDTTVNSSKAAPLLATVGDAGYCSSSSADQQQQSAVLGVRATVFDSVDLTARDPVGDIAMAATVEAAQQQSVALDPYRVLQQRYGIELLPEVEEDGDGHILKQAMDSGHTVSLTEAGRRALSEFKLEAAADDDGDDDRGNKNIETVLPPKRNQAMNNKRKALQVQLVGGGGRLAPSIRTDMNVQQIATIKLPTNNTASTAKRKRLLPPSTCTNKIVLLPSCTAGNADDKQAPSDGSARLHEGITPTTAPSSVDNSTRYTANQKQIRNNKQQQETTLLTLTADEFASLQANGGILTTSNGIYRIMDYTNTPAKANSTKHGRTRVPDTDGSTAVTVRDPAVQQRQLESDTVKSLRQQLQEQRHLVDIYKRKYLKKEAEVERFKQQLKLMLKHRNSNSSLSSAIFNNNVDNGR